MSQILRCCSCVYQAKCKRCPCQVCTNCRARECVRRAPLQSRYNPYALPEIQGRQSPVIQDHSIVGIPPVTQGNAMARFPPVIQGHSTVGTPPVIQGHSIVGFPPVTQGNAMARFPQVTQGHSTTGFPPVTQGPSTVHIPPVIQGNSTTGFPPMTQGPSTLHIPPVIQGHSTTGFPPVTQGHSTIGYRSVTQGHSTAGFTPVTQGNTMARFPPVIQGHTTATFPPMTQGRATSAPPLSMLPSTSGEHIRAGLQATTGQAFMFPSGLQAQTQVNSRASPMFVPQATLQRSRPKGGAYARASLRNTADNYGSTPNERLRHRAGPEIQKEEELRQHNLVSS